MRSQEYRKLRAHQREETKRHVDAYRKRKAEAAERRRQLEAQDAEIGEYEVEQDTQILRTEYVL